MEPVIQFLLELIPIIGQAGGVSVECQAWNLFVCGSHGIWISDLESVINNEKQFTIH